MAGPVQHLDELECMREDLKIVLFSGIKTTENTINQTLCVIVSLWKFLPFIERHQQQQQKSRCFKGLLITFILDYCCSQCVPSSETPALGHKL